MSEEREIRVVGTYCDRCGTLFNGNEKHTECDIHLCKTCHTTYSILPGQYRYALLLWLCWHECHGKTAGALPSFWPQNEKGIALTPIEAISVALRFDLPRLPCADTCSCSHFSHEQEEDDTTNPKCFFHHLEKNSSKGASLLLYWWHIYYTRQSLQPPKFWPTDGGAVISPRQLAYNTTM